MTTSLQPTSATVEADGAPSGVWRVVAEREVTTRMRDKPFIISAIVMLVVVIGSIILLSILGGRPTTHKVAVTDAAGVEVVKASTATIDKLEAGSKATSTRYGDARAAENAVRDGKADAALLRTDSGYEVVGEDKVDTNLSSALASAAASSALQANAAEQDVDLGALQQNTQVAERLLDPDAGSNGERKAVAFVFVLLFYVTALTFGMIIAQSVTQEKESRVVEILAAAIPLRSLLWGKIIGNTVLALGQVVLLVLAAIGALLAVGEAQLLGLVGPAIAMYIVFFVIGFVALASMWVVAGSLASRQQDLGSTTMPVNVLLFAPYILAVTAGEGVKTIVSMLPIVSAMMMPARMAEGSVPVWQIIVAVVSNLVATVVLVWIGAKVYERTLLRTDRKISYKEAFKTAE